MSDAPVTDRRPTFASTSARSSAGRSGRPCETCTAEKLRSDDGLLFPIAVPSTEEWIESSSFHESAGTSPGALPDVTNSRMEISSPCGASSSASVSAFETQSMWPENRSADVGAGQGWVLLTGVADRPDEDELLAPALPVLDVAQHAEECR